MEDVLDIYVRKGTIRKTGITYLCGFELLRKKKKRKKKIPKVKIIKKITKFQETNPFFCKSKI